MGCIPTVLSLLHRRQILEGLIAFALLILERCASIIESHRHMHGIAERLVRRATTTAKVVLSLNLIASHAVVLQMATFGYSDDGILAEWNASLDDIGVVLDDGDGSFPLYGKSSLSLLWCTATLTVRRHGRPPAARLLPRHKSIYANKT